MAINEFLKEKNCFDNILTTLIHTDAYTLLKQEADANNMTVTSLLIELLTHWFDHTDGKLPEKLTLQKNYIIELAKKRDEEIEILMIEALERGINLMVSHNKEHFPMAFPF